MSTPQRRHSHRAGSATLRRGLVASAVFMVSSLTTACLDNKLDPDQVDQEPTARGDNDAGTSNSSDAGGSDAPVAEKKLFIAQNSSFKNYQDWTAFKITVKSEHEGLSGETAIYVSQLPNTETKTFPVGTILFKTTLVNGFDKPVVHAMSKRGSGFNADGALGWEYFELLMGKGDVPYILWRGSKPPAGEMYQALLGAMSVVRPMTTDADCNSCHEQGTDGALGDDVLTLINGQ
jgi:hypothetical protein